MVSKIASFVLIIAICSWVGALSAAAQITMIRILGGRDEVPGVEFAAAVNFTKTNVKATSTILIPDRTQRVRAVVVLLERGLTAQARFRDSAWRKMSEQCECGILYFRLDTIRPVDANAPVSTDLLRNAAAGGADVLFSLLQRLAQESSHPELKDTPMVFWGWSAAASFGTTFAELYPDRTIGFIRYHTHLRGLPVDMKVLTKIPALLIAGGKDETAGIEDAETLWKMGRSVGAPWTFAIEPNASHFNEEVFVSTQELIFPWISAVVSQRVTSGSIPLRDVIDASGLLGNTHNGQITPYATFQGVKTEASWLPNEEAARGWQSVLRIGK